MRGVNLGVLFKQIKSEERHHTITIDEFTVLPADFQYSHAVLRGLNIVAEVCPGLQAFYNTQECWHIVIYLLKHMARAKYAREEFEEIQFLGGDGKNGKGFYMYMLRTIFGEYYSQPKNGIFTNDSTCNSASPDVMEMLGKRVCIVPECEEGIKLKCATLKDLRDQTTVITARCLFKDNKKFCPLFLLIFAANIKFMFTSLDGGAVRSFTAITWPFKFVNNPTPGTNERQAQPVKKQETAALAIPTFDLILRMIDDIFLGDAPIIETVISPRPATVQAASKNLMTSTETPACECFCTDRIDDCSDAKAASTCPQILREFQDESGIKSRQQALALFLANYTRVTSSGRDVLKRKNTKFYAKLRP